MQVKFASRAFVVAHGLGAPDEGRVQSSWTGWSMQMQTILHLTFLRCLPKIDATWVARRQCSWRCNSRLNLRSVLATMSLYNRRN